MLPNKLETEADSPHFATTSKKSCASQELSSPSTTTKTQNHQDVKDGREPRRKVKRARSVKLVRLPSLKIISSKGKPQPASLSSSSSSTDAQSSLQSFPEGTSDNFPNYMKTTSSSSAKMEISQDTSSQTLTKRYSSKPGRSLLRLSRSKSRRSFIRKSSGGAEMKRKLKKSKSIRLVNRPVISDLEEVESQSNPQTHESGFSINDENNQSSSRSKVETASSSSNKSLKVMVRSSSLRPLRRLTKVASLKGRRPAGSRNKFTGRSEPDCSIHKATCSSALKESKFPDHLELHPGEGSQSERISKVKVCPYSYCSLHGHHHHHPAPLPVRSFISMKRNQSKSQKISSIKDSLDGSSLVQKDAKLLRETLLGDHEGVATVEKVVQQATQSNTLASSIDDPESSTTECNVDGEPLGGSYHLISEGISTPRNEKGIAEDIPIATAEFEHDNVAYDSPKNHVGLWRRIYQHMLSGLAAEDDIQTADGKGENMNNKNSDNALPGIHNSELNQSIRLEAHDVGSSNIFVYQHDAIKLVQEAFDKILSQIPDPSSANQSFDGDTLSSNEAEENDCLKGAKSSISPVSHLDEHTVAQHEGELGVEIDSTNGSEGVKAESNVGRMSERRGHKSWSNVKRVLVLKRFVKALEKVKKIEPRRPRVLPADLDPQREKVQLRHLIMEDRKNSENWMLDYALQKVISTLVPAQKRKVALLVQAFESVIPEIGSPPSSKVISPTETLADSCSSFPDQMVSEKVKKTCFAVFDHDSTNSKQNQGPFQYRAAEDHISEHGSESEEEPSTEPCNISEDLREKVTSTDYDLKDCQDGLYGASLLNLAEPKLLDKPSSKETYTFRDHGEEFLISGLHLEISTDAGSGSTSTVLDLYPEINTKKLDNDVQKNPASEPSREPGSLVSEGDGPVFAYKDVVSSASNSGSLENSEEATETETKLKGKFLQLFNVREESQPKVTRDALKENQIEKPSTRLWYLIYKHMVSGSRTLPEELNREEKGDGTNTSTPTNADLQQGSSVSDQEAYVENKEKESNTEELQQIEAIRLVEEAIDDIPLPEAQEELHDAGSVRSDTILENAGPRKEHGKTGELVIPTTNGFTKEIPGPGVSNVTNAGQPQEAAKLDPNVVEKAKPRIQKSWSNVKKVILLQRFMKSMEKVKKINPRKPRFLSLDPVEEAETVNLRHMGFKDRKNSDEWMLDYALQQVVSKLTPARKRKVQLLVEAFETVVPASWS